MSQKGVPASGPMSQVSGCVSKCTKESSKWVCQQVYQRVSASVTMSQKGVPASGPMSQKGVPASGPMSQTGEASQCTKESSKWVCQQVYQWVK